MHATTDPQRPASSQSLGHSGWWVPRGLGPRFGALPVRGFIPLGCSPDPASLALSVLQALLGVVLVHQQAPARALGGGERGHDARRDPQGPQHCVEGAESAGPQGLGGVGVRLGFSGSPLGRHCLKCQVTAWKEEGHRHGKLELTAGTGPRKARKYGAHSPQQGSPLRACSTGGAAGGVSG